MYEKQNEIYQVHAIFYKMYELNNIFNYIYHFLRIIGS